MPDLAELIAALKAQTEAINNLAASNAMLVDAMAQADGLEQDEGYLDGGTL